MSSHDPRLVNSMGGNVSVQSPKCFKAYYEMMSVIRRKESMYSTSTLLLYHYTSPSVASLILKGGLRMSTQGQGDGGVYFSLKGPASYGYGLDAITRPTPTTTTATTNNANSIPPSLSTSGSDKNSGETSDMDYESRLIIDCYGKERLHEYYGKNMLSLVLVCAIEEGILTKAPGGRDNALVREK
jgi:hypothetical protein